MNYKILSNDQLISTLKSQVENERKLLMEILHSLREVEDRNLHLAMGYPDIYTFAMKELGYTSGAAYRRISAMRLLKSVPEAAPKLESGELGLENASQAQSFFRKEDQVRKEHGQGKLTHHEKREVVLELVGKSTREGQRILLEKSPEAMTPTEKLKPLPSQKTLIQFVADEELMQMLEELKNILAHQNYEGRMDVLMKKMASLALEKLNTKRAGQTALNPLTQVANSNAPIPDSAPTQASAKASPQRDSSPAPGKTKSRYIPVAVKRVVRQRDQDGCTFRDSKSGRVCQSRHCLQFDHIVPFSRGGENTATNLTLRCGSHNRYRAEKMGLGWKHRNLLKKTPSQPQSQSF